MTFNDNPTIVQKNIVLAQFDPNATHSKIEKYDAWWLGGRLYGEATLDYHKSFDLLMPLVSYIESLGFSVNINGTSCIISNKNMSIKKKEESKELSIFNCCYEFITESYYLTCGSCGQYKDILRYFNKEKQKKFYCKSCGLISDIQPN